MITILKNEIARTRKGLLIWCLIAGLIAYLGILEYPMLASNFSTIEQALAMIPKLGQLVFGVYNVNLYEPIDYYIVMYYWTGLIVFTHAIYVGASIIMKEQRDKTAEFIFTKPYTRSTIVWAKIIAGLWNIFVMGIVTIVLSLIGMLQATGDATLVGAVVVSGIGMLLTQLLLMSLAFLCSAIFKSYKSGVTVAMFVLIASYFLMFAVQYVDMPLLNFLSPLAFFGVSEVVSNGLSLIYIGLSAVVVAACFYFTQRLYSKKEMIG